MKQPTRVAIYVRISRDTEGAGLGVERQEAECRELAERHGWQVAQVLVDNDVSAYSGKSRPSYDRLLRAIERGEVDAVIAWAPDRLYRRLQDLSRFVETVSAAKVQVRTVTSGSVDLTTADGQMHATIVAAVAIQESQRKSERLRAKHRQIASEGRHAGGGPRAFGYSCRYPTADKPCTVPGCRHDGVSIIEAEAEAVRWAAARILDGWSLRRVVKAMPLPSTLGNPWQPITVRRVLTAPRTAGLREHHGEIAGEAVWPELLDRATWEAVRVVLTDPARNKRHTSRRYVLAGLVYTAEGEKMVARPTAEHRRRYVQEQGRCNIDADNLEALIIEAVLQRTDAASFPVRSHEVDPDAAAEVREIEQRLAEAAQLYGDRVISLQEWVTAKKPLDAALAAARDRLRPIGAPAGIAAALAGAGALRTSWPELDHDTRRDVLGALIERIEIGPGIRGLNKFDPRRVNVIWRA
jgi:site-specific DNA recombinase